MSRTPSLESLIETEDIGVEIFHPGGLGMTRELAEHCRIGSGTRVLDVASGTGETACYLAERLGARVVGIDRSAHLLRRARAKAAQRRLGVEFVQGDAERLGFTDASFDVVISECTLCLLDKERALAEMVRVAAPGGRVGMHDLCWRAQAPARLKRRLAELEDERPETLRGWRVAFENAGLADVHALDRSSALGEWTASISRSLGFAGRLRIFARVLRTWGVAGLLHVRASERVFRSEHTGYGIVVGSKPPAEPA